MKYTRQGDVIFYGCRLSVVGCRRGKNMGETYAFHAHRDAHMSVNLWRIGSSPATAASSSVGGRETAIVRARGRLESWHRQWTWILSGNNSNHWRAYAMARCHFHVDHGWVKPALPPSPPPATWGSREL